MICYQSIGKIPGTFLCFGVQLQNLKLWVISPWLQPRWHVFESLGRFSLLSIPARTFHIWGDTIQPDCPLPCFLSPVALCSVKTRNALEEFLLPAASIW